MIFNFLLDSRRWTAAALLRSKKTSLCDSDAFMQEKSKRKSAEIEIGVKVFASLLSLLNKKQGKLCFLYEESRPLVLFPGNKVEILRRESGVYFAFCSAMAKRAVSTMNCSLRPAAAGTRVPTWCGKIISYPTTRKPLNYSLAN